MFYNLNLKLLIIFIFTVYVNLAYSQNDELLSRTARYKIFSWIYSGPCHRLPQTNIEPPKWDFYELDYVQNSDYGKALIDGKGDGQHSIKTWWRGGGKKVHVIFDLGGACKLSQIVAYAMKNKKLTHLLDNLTIYIKNSKNAEWQEIGKIVNDAKLLPEEKRPPIFSFKKDNINKNARYVKLVFYSARSRIFVISEIKIYGQRLEPNSFKDKFGLIRTTNRKIKAEWSKIPKFADDIYKIKGPTINCSLMKKYLYKGKSEEESDKQGGKLLDDNQNTSIIVTNKDQWYTYEQLTIIVDLKQKYNIERVILWSSGHSKKNPQSFINYYSIAIKNRFWLPVCNKINNPFWPGESIKNQDFYPIISPQINKSTRFLRIDVYKNRENAHRMQISEIDIFGKLVK